MKNKPLDGIKILDLSWVFSAPFSTLLLQDLGAEVVKVERPVTGDRARSIPPFKDGMSGYFYMLNRGKKSISLNLKNEEGRRIFLKLTKHFDVIVENFAAGTMDKLGLSYEEIKKTNSKIIFASINGFGSSGPYADRLSIDGIAQAMGGLMSQTGMKDGTPLKTGPAIADTVAGVYMAVGVLSALLERNITGLGQKLEVSMMDSVFSLLEDTVIRASMTGNSLPIRGNTDPLGAPWDAFQTSDEKRVMVCSMDGDKFYEIYKHIGREDIAEEYKGNDRTSYEKRSRDLEELNLVFAKWAMTKTASELTTDCINLGVPVGEIKYINELLEDPHLKERNMVVDVNHPDLGEIKLPNIPIHFFNHEIGINPNESLNEPNLGEHNYNILQTLLGMDKKEINRLIQAGVLYQ
ncbi:CaiB/BaiF CoA transferase family protein [Virgibacillus necropolis]|uniref:CoA transferase n=1 Tax=Virgibacillus necropolis TaxID=163877 RepID=A0A221M9J5_9BACI|nr:CaiB/BaiF CoA-transferase family protein [Virgibacillus necropolis]ASN04290.1 CoA transferase [Virgibacillus necropolis]